MNRQGVNILHLSDLHFGAEPFKDVSSSAIQLRNKILNNLIEALKNAPEEWKPDVIAVTGDIGWKACKEDYDIAIKWFEKLSEELNIQHENFIFCPGNHDIDRNELKYSNKIGTVEDAKEYLSTEQISRRSKHFRNYVQFCKNFFVPQLLNGANNDNENDIKYLYGYREICDIGFIVINSSWCCSGNNDFGNLWIGEYLVLDIESNIPENDNKVIITLFHHPFEYTNIEERKTYFDEPTSRKSLINLSDIILNGHVHGSIEKADILSKKTHVLTSGATYQSNTYKLFCQIINIDTIKLHIFYKNC